MFSVVCSINERNNQKCPKCKGEVDRFIGNPAVVGTRDNFGIKNEFKDDKTGKTIDTWKKWENAGFRNPLDVTKNHDVREKLKEKIKIKKKENNK